jgi:pyrroline-5-carboxylate reductase
MICLPSIARHQGVCLHCSPTPNPWLTELFQSTGGVVTLQTEAELEACMVTTCIMGPMYGIMRQGRDWLLQNTKLSPEDASYLVTQQYIGAVQDVERGGDLRHNANRLDDLINEQTKGGLNEQALANLDKLGGLKAQTQVMDATVSRIRGETDGSV